MSGKVELEKRRVGKGRSGRLFPFPWNFPSNQHSCLTLGSPPTNISQNANSCRLSSPHTIFCTAFRNRESCKEGCPVGEGEVELSSLV